MMLALIIWTLWFLAALEIERWAINLPPPMWFLGFLLHCIAIAISLIALYNIIRSITCLIRVK